MDPSHRIRRLTRRDWPDILRVVRSAWHRSYAGTGEYYTGTQSLPRKIRWLRGGLGDPAWTWLGAWTGEAAGRTTLAGLVIGLRWRGHFWVMDLFVARNQRRRGVATALVRRLIRGRRRVYAEINLDNSGSRSLFDSLGFRTVLSETLVVR